MDQILSRLDFLERNVNNNSEIERLQKEVQKWKTAYENLKAHHEAYVEMVAREKPELQSVVSNGAVDRFVEELLNDPAINIYLLPDQIERPIYANTLKILLSILQKLFNNAGLDLIGHEFTVQMRPTLETTLKDEN